MKNTSNTETLIRMYNNHIEEWKKLQQVVQVNLKALAIILQKFLLFNVKDQPDDDGLMVDRIIDSYQNSNKKCDFDLLESYSEEFREELDSGAMESPPSDSALLSSLIINHPGTVDLFLQRQSNKVLQIIAEIAYLYEEFKAKQLRKMAEICQECEIIVNRNLNSNINPKQNNESSNFDHLRYVSTSFNGISDEINTINQFCVSLDLYPTHDDRIKKHLQFLEDFKFFKV